MIGISKLYCGTVEPSDPLRYGRASGQLPSHLLQFSEDKKPVVVWNATRRCNLRCVHCYADCNGSPDPDELTTGQAKTFIDDLAGFGCPVLLISGGEPMLRDDLDDLIAHARAAGLRVVLSTNGTLITPAAAERFRQLELSYVGVSLDGATATINDRFRGREGAFSAALGGIHHCLAAGVKVGLRLTLNKTNAEDLKSIFQLIERKTIPRVCFYHLVSAGRGGQLGGHLLTAEQTRRAVDTILAETRRLHEAGNAVEVLTVDNHADGPYLYMKRLREDPAQAANILQLLRMNGGNGSGRSIGCVSWNGQVHPDQFWRTQVVGDIRRRPFSDIWTDPDQPLLRQLRNRREHLHCRCRHCRFLDVCNGNLRARAEAAGNGPWGDDPGCYLSDEEIAP